MEWKKGKPDKSGRYFVLVDFLYPVQMEKLNRVTRENVPMVSNYTVEEGWACLSAEITVTHWMEVPELKSEKFQFIQIDLTKPPERPDPLFKVEKDGINLRWNGYDYFIEWNRLKTKEDILRWICHVGEKEWAETTPDRIVRFIHAVYKKHDWDMYPTE